MNSLTQLGRKGQDAQNRHQNACDCQHALEHENQNPGFMLDGHKDHVDDPTDTDAIQKEPPQGVNAILNVSVPGAGIEGEEEVAF